MKKCVHVTAACVSNLSTTTAHWNPSKLSCPDPHRHSWAENTWKENLLSGRDMQMLLSLTAAKPQLLQGSWRFCILLSSSLTAHVIGIVIKSVFIIIVVAVLVLIVVVTVLLHYFYQNKLQRTEEWPLENERGSCFTDRGALSFQLIANSVARDTVQLNEAQLRQTQWLQTVTIECGREIQPRLHTHPQLLSSAYYSSNVSISLLLAWTLCSSGACTMPLLRLQCTITVTTHKCRSVIHMKQNQPVCKVNEALMCSKCLQYPDTSNPTETIQQLR